MFITKFNRDVKAGIEAPDTVYLFLFEGHPWNKSFGKGKNWINSPKRSGNPSAMGVGGVVCAYWRSKRPGNYVTQPSAVLYSIQIPVVAVTTPTANKGSPNAWCSPPKISLNLPGSRSTVPMSVFITGFLSRIGTPWCAAIRKKFTSWGFQCGKKPSPRTECRRINGTITLFLLEPAFFVFRSKNLHLF